MLAPIIVNIAAFHIFLAPSPGMVVLLLALGIFLAWSYRDAFAPMLRSRVTPRAPAEDRAPKPVVVAAEV